MKKIIFLLLAIFTLQAKEQTIVLGAGCFWGVEKHFESLKGVKDVVSGYAGGDFENPTYSKVLAHRLFKDRVNHAEVVRVTYDDSVISTRKILEEFWEIHDPTQKNRQGNDYGNNYRSIILYTNSEQKRLAYETKEEFQKLLNSAGYGKIVTEIKPLKKFYMAEEKHQDYLKKHPRGYCPNHATGVKFAKKASSKKMLTPLGGKEILVIDAKDCPFCERFKKDVVSSYKGTIPLRVSHFENIKGFKLNGEIVGTPTIIFIENGKEVTRFIGYLSPKEFYRALGAFKLGKDSKAYDIAYNKSTERRFCKKYKEFRNTGDGVFIDKISGDILFDTKDRFNSHSGWLSFYKAVDGSVEFREDNSYGMKRIEVIAKKSGAHLGHVFPRADGRVRFCINANVLEFVPREKLGK